MAAISVSAKNQHRKTTRIVKRVERRQWRDNSENKNDRHQAAAAKRRNGRKRNSNQRKKSMKAFGC